MVTATKFGKSNCSPALFGYIDQIWLQWQKPTFWCEESIASIASLLDIKSRHTFTNILFSSLPLIHALNDGTQFNQQSMSLLKEALRWTVPCRNWCCDQWVACQLFNLLGCVGRSSFSFRYGAVLANQSPHCSHTVCGGQCFVLVVSDCGDRHWKHHSEYHCSSVWSAEESPQFSVLIVWSIVCSHFRKIADLSVPLTPPSLLPTFVVFLLTLRSNQGLDRLSQGRAAFGLVVLYTRDLTHLISEYVFPPLDPVPGSKDG